MKIIRKYVSPAALAVGLAAIIVGYLLFWPPINGYADNGGFEKILQANNLYPLHDTNAAYVAQKYGLMHYYNPDFGQPFSTQTIFIQLAILLNRLFYSQQIFDIRFLGLVYLGLFLGGVRLLVKALTKNDRRIRNYLIALLTVFVLGDSSFTLYFNSFYPQAGNLILMVYCVAILLIIAHNQFKRRWLWLALYFLSAFALLMNSYNNKLLYVSLAISALGLFALPKFRLQRFYLAIGIVLIVIGGFWTKSLIPADVAAVDHYQSFTRGVLVESKNPDKKIKAGGIDGQYTLMRNNNYYPDNYTELAPNTAHVQKNLLTKYNLLWVIKYYAGSLHQLQLILNDASKNTMITKLDSVGNYPKSAKKTASAQTKYFTLFSQFMGAFFPTTFGFSILLSVAFIILYFVSLMRTYRQNKVQAVMKLCLVGGMTTMAIVATIGFIFKFGLTNLSQYLSIVALTWDLAFLIFISDSLNHRLWGGGKA
ncbi:hypothetical protein ACFQ5M_05255 [Agrilactobacillus yilanensis]|uniref:Glycosyltransferase RgtA/B/C/D-like domain-containing protein n=1 Tax=Agrilactobacillus yilanensis TaxID=2485997 RepID=A0ABW4J7R7_9LACO|nr:hypothetical protein [Agrilactobacillus yilanensis]